LNKEKNKKTKRNKYMLEFKNPILVVTPLGRGYVVYAASGGTFENDIWTVALEDGGKVFHFRSDQIMLHSNSTFDIKKPKQSNKNEQDRRGIS